MKLPNDAVFCHSAAPGKEISYRFLTTQTALRVNGASSPGASIENKLRQRTDMPMELF
jgi:hypothetical protein